MEREVGSDFNRSPFPSWLERSGESDDAGLRGEEPNPGFDRAHFLSRCRWRGWFRIEQFGEEGGGGSDGRVFGFGDARVDHAADDSVLDRAREDRRVRQEEHGRDLVESSDGLVSARAGNRWSTAGDGVDDEELEVDERSCIRSVQTDDGAWWEDPQGRLDWGESILVGDHRH